MKTATENQPTTELITKAELSKKLKVTQKTIENWVKSGRISHIKIGTSTVRFDWRRVLEEIGTANTAAG